jgi:prepilin-type N-terminal cleavage/methylation domain-containing protein
MSNKGHALPEVRRGRRSGLTLVELLVVLVILAVLSTLALRATAGLLDQSRYEGSRLGLEDVRRAVLGDSGVEAGEAVGGYVRDTGNLPTSLDDLLTQPSALSAHAVQEFDSDDDGTNDVTMASGWFGPYLQLGPGQTQIRDGWGRACAYSAGPPATVRSLGADGDSDPPEEGYDADLVVTIAAEDYQAPLVTCRLYELDSSGNLADPALDAGDTLELRLYAVNPADGQVGGRSITVTAPTFSHQLTDQTIGPICMRALHRDAAGVIKKKSTVLYVMLRARVAVTQPLVMD